MASTDGIDTGKLSTHIAQRAIDRLFDLAEAKVKEKWAQHKNKHTTLFSEYIESQSKKCSLVRTLIYDKQSAYLPEIYVPLRARMLMGIGRNSRFEEKTTEDFIELLAQEHDKDSKERRTLAAILSAPAGAGKTFFMRNLYIRLAHASSSKIPVFLDARELNRVQQTDLAGIISIAFRITGHELSREQASDGLKSGLFQILIDGFDELRLSHERHYANVLEQASHAFQLCPIVISGRPSDLLHAFNYFCQCDLVPLAPEESIQLVQKQEFDAATKRSFIALMHKELFTSHAEFLELPLLCVVMLLTYSDSGRISHKEHEFYEDAFNALWGKHDARKQAGYEREKYTLLDKNDFIKLLSAFCASSYIVENFSMRETEVSHHLTRAKKLTDIFVKTDDFIKDMTTSTSLLVSEGTMYRFAHRSFQEYFCARYVLALSDNDISTGIEAISSRYETDSVLDFVRSMNAERFETAWVIPKLTAIVPKLQGTEHSFREYSKLFFDPDGVFLQKLRQIYSMKPSNESLSGAIAAWRDMWPHDIGSFRNVTDDPQRNLFLKDIFNFEKLLQSLTKRYDDRSAMRAALFEGGNPQIKSASKKRR